MGLSLGLNALARDCSQLAHIATIAPVLLYQQERLSGIVSTGEIVR